MSSAQLLSRQNNRAGGLPLLSLASPTSATSLVTEPGFRNAAGLAKRHHPVIIKPVCSAFTEFPWQVTLPNPTLKLGNRHGYWPVAAIQDRPGKLFHPCSQVQLFEANQIASLAYIILRPAPLPGGRRRDVRGQQL